MCGGHYFYTVKYARCNVHRNNYQPCLGMFFCKCPARLVHDDKAFRQPVKVFQNQLIDLLCTKAAAQDKEEGLVLPRPDAEEAEPGLRSGACITGVEDRTDRISRDATLSVRQARKIGGRFCV